MGGSLITEEIDGSLTRDGVRKHFEEMREQAAFEHGHSAYSGSWNTLEGVVFPDVPVFPDARAATDYIDEHAVKWEAALAVRFRKRVRVNVRRPTFKGQAKPWVNSVYEVDHGLAGDASVVPADQLGDRDRTALIRAVRRQRAAAIVASAADSALRATLEALFDLTAVPAGRIRAEQSAAGRARAELRRATDALQALTDRLTPRLYAYQESDHGELWLIGGIASM